MRREEAALSIFFAALTAAGSPLAIPISPVPFTLQTFFVLLAGMVGGVRVGFTAILIYLFMGAVGVPVFANFKGGWQVFLGPTGGYLISFPFASALAGYVYNRIGMGRVLGAAAGAAAAEALIYLIGVPWLASWLVFNRGLSVPDSLSQAVVVGMTPFLVWDTVKATIAVYVSTRHQIVNAVIKYVKAVRSSP
ncbi:MAG: biotin transporter BioY [Candidatus Bathyarchaeia archaeon]